MLTKSRVELLVKNGLHGKFEALLFKTDIRIKLRNLYQEI